SNVGCAPFVLNSNNIQAISHPDRNAVYKWYANGQEIGTGIQFPGYTITQSEDTVTISLVVTSSLGCKEAEFSQDFITQSNLSASFVQDITEGCGPLDVVFTNTSSFISGASFLWDFGNGETSTSPNPGSVRFLPDPTGRDKVYTVTLTASSACSASEVFTATVLVKAAPLAVFSPDRTISCSPMQVTFSNTSLETSNTTYTFDFGDGSEPVIRTDRSSVTHTFLAIEEAQTFTITMTARNECGEHSSSHTVTVTPGTVQAELVVNSTDQRGCVPFTVPFYNNSSGASTYVYDFGDGTTLTTNSAPERVLHTYTNAGEYLVTLTASNGCSVVSTTETVTVLPQPEASFDILGQAFVSEALRFNNTSTGGDLLY
ncbi:PKD domain-containing protein, partial [Pseudoxanthomonas sp. SGD-10]